MIKDEVASEQREKKGNLESEITRGKENFSSRRGDKRAQQHSQKNISSEAAEEDRLSQRKRKSSH